MIFTQKLRQLLSEQGADLVGFGDLSEISKEALPRCVSLAVKLPAKIVAGIAQGPTMEYYKAYHSLNAQLDALAEFTAATLQREGFQAKAQTTTTVVETADHRTSMPHKTCATRSGLGWIGKSALLVTPEFGSAIRLTSVLTDAVFDKLGTPITTSRCGECQQCKNACPGSAILGALWETTIERERLVNVEHCRRAARKLALERTGKEITLCGKCIEVCPYTQKYLKRELSL